MQLQVTFISPLTLVKALFYTLLDTMQSFIQFLDVVKTEHYHSSPPPPN